MRVVLVDPSRTVLKFVSRLLEARNHDVRAFVEGRAALDYIQSDPIVGALITNDELISMSGIELCWETRLIAGCSRPIYVILMSSNQDRHKLIEALDSGADDYIGKPPIAEELYARLRAAERLAAMQENLRRLATTDPLTGALNRRAFFERAEEVCARAKRGGVLSSLMIDIDHFKLINDIFGHDVGDTAICAVVREAGKRNAVLGRLGGEEFALLLENCPLSEAVEIADDLRRKIAALEFDTSTGCMTMTCSLGVSTWEEGDTIDTMLKRADIALYAAKTGGRNRVIAADENLRMSGDEDVESTIRQMARA